MNNKNFVLGFLTALLNINLLIGAEQEARVSIWETGEAASLINNLVHEGKNILDELKKLPLGIERQALASKHLEIWENKLLDSWYILYKPLLNALIDMPFFCELCTPFWSLALGGIMIYFIHKTPDDIQEHSNPFLFRREYCRCPSTKKVFAKATHYSALSELDRVRTESELECLISNYKIHLMPHDKDLLMVLKKLFFIIRDDDNFRKGICDLKVKPMPEELLDIDIQLAKEINEEFGLQARIPIIVIYMHGKENTQYALNKIYEAFKEIPGSGLAPAFNEGIPGGLIYFTQGDRNDKIVSPRMFTKDRIYFDEEFIKTNFKMSKQIENFKIKNPAISQ